MQDSEQAPFVVLEGLDGAGTTTQVDLVVEALRARGLQVCATAEPSDGPLGRVARAHVKGEISLAPLTATFAFTADRADHLHRVVRPARLSGTWVLCDRYLLSTLAYQGAEGIDREWIVEISRGFDAPDVTVFLDVPEAERIRRVASRAGRDRYEDPALQTAVRTSYLASIDLLRDRGHRIVALDATGAPEEVRDRILEAVDGAV